MIIFNTKIILSLIIGLLFSGIALYFTFINIPLEGLTEYITTINHWWILPSLVFALISLVLRVIRWQVILKPVRKTGFRQAFHPLMIGFMINCVFPGRVGEIARPAILYKRDGIEFSKGLATVVAERIFDLIALFVSFICILMCIDINRDLDITFGEYHLTTSTLNTIWATTLATSIILIGMILAIIISRSRSMISRTIMRSPDMLIFADNHIKEKLRAGICAKIVHVLNNIAHGFEVLRNPKDIVLCLLHSFLIWGLVVLSLYVLAFGYPGISISFFEAYTVEIIICFFIMLPSVPGYWGLWEAGGVFGLLIFGIPAKEAAGLILIYHLIHVIPVIIIGIGSAMITGVNIFQSSRNGEKALHIQEEQNK
ncbi:MAG TPA: flippase-like domain-containing protein [Deltaproteobacteria bacterium]|nr:flippase-like domain-containing protein [Deltaproteobacteria bacterium]